MPKSKQAGHSRLFILFHFFIALPLYSSKRKRSWVFNIVRMLSPFQLGDVRSSCRPKWKELISENLLCCNKCRVLLVSCWWPFNVFILQQYSEALRFLPLPLHPWQLPSPLSLPTQAQDFIMWRREFTVTFKGYAEFEEKGRDWFYYPGSSLPSAQIDVLL